MREIKFRAWDTKRQEMWSPEEMGKDQLTLSPDGRGFVNVNGMSTKFSQWMSHLIPEQYTGLKDKNGKEIYEGDILTYTRTHWYCPGHPEHHKDLKDRIHVYWNKEEAGFWEDTYDEKRCYSSGSLSFKDNRADKNIIEIIGNIHENKELLENSEPPANGNGD